MPTSLINMKNVLANALGVQYMELESDPSEFALAAALRNCAVSNNTRPDPDIWAAEVELDELEVDNEFRTAHCKACGIELSPVDKGKKKIRV